MKPCSGLSCHITDSRFFRSSYATDEARRIFCDLRRMQRWLDVEIALAQSQAELGIIPQGAADELEKTGKVEHLDISGICADLEKTCHSLMPLLSAWQKVTSEESGRFIHFGATTQDIQDTAQALEIRDATGLILRDLHVIGSELMALAETHRKQVMIGRTHGQHALPMVFGLKAATWLDELLRNIGRMSKSCAENRVSQLFGGVGTMDAFGSNGLELLNIFSEKLGLQPPLVAWHASRDRSADLLAAMALVAGGLARIANEIVQLARDEIHELEEPFHMGKIGSSTMPHKRNPELCEQVVVLARLIKANAALGFDALISEHERDYRTVRLEWVTLVDSALYLCSLTGLMKKILAGLRVDTRAMEANVKKSAALISTEALMFLIGKKIGKQAAHQLLYDLSMRAHDGLSTLIDLLLADERLSGLTEEQLQRALDPAVHVGLSGELIDRVLTAARETLDPSGPEYASSPCPLAGKEGCRFP